MTEQQKPLEEGWYFGRPNFEHPPIWRPVLVLESGDVEDWRDYAPMPLRHWEIGPRLTPPQEKEDREKALSEMQRHDMERGRV